MAYVARFAHDIFVRYARNDDPAWIEAFETSLRQELAERLGDRASLWQDVARLRVSQDWKIGIEEGVTGSAVFLALVSPSYQTSEWCAKERKLFFEQFPSREEMKVETKGGASYRFVKVHKLPWPDDAHLEFFADAQAVDFFRYDEADGIPDEMRPGTDAFRAAMRQTAHGLSSLLLAMRRSGERVFIATPAEDVERPGRALRDELLAQGYNVQPPGPLDEAYSDDAVRKAIGTSKVSVHLLGARYDAGAERLARIVQDLEIPRVVWLSRDAKQTSSEQQRAFIARVTATANGGPVPTLLTGTEARMIEEVRQTLAPALETSTSVSSSGGGSVYLLCDPSSPRDADAGAELGRQIKESEGFDVLLPEVGSSSRLLVEAHEWRLRHCDGLLLLKREAPLSWLFHNYGDVLKAEQTRVTPLRSKAFLLDDPALLPGAPNVISLTDTPTLDGLAPFLTAVRAAEGDDAHA